LRRIVTILAASVADLRIAQVGEGHVVELQVAAARPGERADRGAVDLGRVLPEFVEVGIGLLRDAGAARAQMQHRRLRDGELAGLLRDRFQEREVVHHDRLRVAELADDVRYRRLVHRAVELGRRPRDRRERHAVELREEVEVPPVAAELAVGDRLEADRLLLRHDSPDRLLARPFVLGHAGRAQQAAHLVCSERGAHQSALAPESFTAFAHFCTSSRRNAANSPEVLLCHSRPSCCRRSLTSGADSARVTSELMRLTRSAGVPAGAKNAVQVRSSKPEKPSSFSVGTSGSAGERCALVTAIARTRTPFTCGTAGGIEVLEICVWPATAAPTACAGWYGTCVMSTLAAILRRSIERCVVVPMPEEA